MRVDTWNLVENEVVDLPEPWQQRVLEGLFPSELLTDQRVIRTHFATGDEAGRRLVASLNGAGSGPEGHVVIDFTLAPGAEDPVGKTSRPAS
jgi:hypothetical protein